MCYLAKCSSCGKSTWAGCGKHVPSVYEKAPKDNLCMCKVWPGVELPKQTAAAETVPITGDKEAPSPASEK